MSSRVNYYLPADSVPHMAGASVAFAIVVVFSVLSAFRIFVQSPDLIGFLAGNTWICTIYIFLMALFMFSWTGFEIVKWWGFFGVIVGAAIPTYLGYLGPAGYAELCLLEVAATVPIYFVKHARTSKRKATH